MSIRDKILKADDIRKEPKEIPQWDFKGYVQEMSMDDFNKYVKFGQELSTYQEGKPEAISEADGLRLQAFIACLTLRDLKGKRVLKDDDFEELSSKNPLLVIDVGRTALDISNLSIFMGKDAEKK
jgi:hypothetical protein